MRRVGLWVAIAGVAACGGPDGAEGAGSASGEASATDTGSEGSAGSGLSAGSEGSEGSEGSSEGSTGGTVDLGGGEVGCGAADAAMLMACVDPERYVADVEFIAAARTPGSPHWQAVQDRCAEALEGAGFVVELHAYGSGVNVIGELPGVGPEADEVVLLGAHYDHIAGCAGADDNASGVAGALEVARVLGAAQLGRTVVVACWDEEEEWLRGSLAYAEERLDPGAVVIAVNFDMIGYADTTPGSQIFPEPLAERFPALAAELAANEGRGDFIAVVSDDLGEAFALDLEGRAEGLGRLTGVMSLSAEEKLSGTYDALGRSDHRSFWERGVPAVHVVDTGVFRYPGYHCWGGPDTVDRLDHGFAFDVVRATVGAMAAAAIAGG